MRRVLALAAGAVAAAGGALILGEYELEGMTPVVAGVLFGLVVAEVVTAAGKRRDVPAAVASAAVSAAGMTWAAWRSTGPDEHWSLVPGMAWVGVGLAALAALAWVRTPGRRAARSRPEP
ncbi:MAG: hypothetical protein ACRD0N_09910 [Acidimicrobiales bacterium]